MKFSWPLVIFVVIGVVVGIVIAGILSNFTGYPEIVRAIGIAVGVFAGFYGHNLWLKRAA
jgi:uncharacterized protein YacL